MLNEGCSKKGNTTNQDWHNLHKGA